MLTIPFVPLRSAKAGFDEGIWPGMSISQFRSVRPHIVPDKVPFNRHLEKKDQFLAMQGVWSFDFKNGILNKISFLSRGDGVFSLENNADKELAKQLAVYKKRLKRTEQALRKLMGPPSKVSDFLSRQKPKDQTSTTVYSATWKKDKLLVRLELNFEGYSGLQMNNAAASPLRYEILVSFQGAGATGDIPGHGWAPGMNAKAFANMEKELLPDGLAEKGQWGVKKIVHGVQGDWTFTFDRGKLDWYSFTRWWREPTELNAKSFSEGLAAARALIKEYRARYGKPISFYEKNASFRDPKKYHHWGYDVIEAKWITPKSKIKVSFDFEGGKGQYSLFLEVGVFRRDYPCF